MCEACKKYGISSKMMFVYEQQQYWLIVAHSADITMAPFAG
jgi:hypothetical protein